MADGMFAGRQDGNALAEIVVPDSHTGFVRLLLFLYTGKYPRFSHVPLVPYPSRERRFLLSSMINDAGS